MVPRLNCIFMFVEAFYGYLTDSLGLLSDSAHMFFDCLALVLGLFATIAIKWPPTERFPYGLSQIEALSGLANGILLVCVVAPILVLLWACKQLTDRQGGESRTHF